LQVTGPEATRDLAECIAPWLRAGDTLLLSGEIGAGKTHFARSVIQTLQAAHGMAEDVPSPSFTLVQTYMAGDLEIWHADMYRLTQPDELLELGLEEALDTALCMIEWPDRLAGMAPDDALELAFTLGQAEGTRDITLTSAAPAWKTRLAGCIAA